MELVHWTWQDQGSSWSKGDQRKDNQKVWTSLQRQGTVFSWEVPRISLRQLRGGEGLSQDSRIGGKVGSMWKMSQRFRDRVLEVELANGGCRWGSHQLMD